MLKFARRAIDINAKKDNLKSFAFSNGHQESPITLDVEFI